LEKSEEGDDKNMVRYLLIFSLVFVSSNIFAQRKNYGLSSNDLQMLMGSYMEGDCSTKMWGEETFSWGEQLTGINNGLIIDYSRYLERNKLEYADCLTISIGSFFAITEIKKIDEKW
jgi:hypothetical protein